jgi:putative FmdB family regulatory protein
MPTYEYECTGCGKFFEKFQNMSDRPIERCPDCSGKVRRLISGGSCVLIKGADTSCALRSTGRTCCGRDERCGKPPCGGEP